MSRTLGSKNKHPRSDRGVPRSRCATGCSCGKHSRPEMSGNMRGAVSKPRQPGPGNPGWMGDAALKQSIKERGRRVARKLYPLVGVICERCKSAPAEHRHHKDGNTHNNVRSNVLLCCEPCHVLEEHEVYAGR